MRNIDSLPMRSFRMAIVGNTCNYGVWLAILLKRFHQDIEIVVLIEDNSISRDKPDWDSLSSLIDGYDIRVETFNPSGLNQLIGFFSTDRRKALEVFDCIYCFGLMAAMYVRNTGLPYIYHSYGDILSTPFNDQWLNFKSWLRVLFARRALRSSSSVVTSQYADLAITSLLGVAHKLHEVPIMHGELLCDSGKSVSNLHETFRHQGLKFYLPARHEKIKRLDKAINAIADVVEELGLSDIKIILTSWGSQTEHTEQLIAVKKLERYCVWIPLQNRAELLSNLRASDTIVLDEFEDENIEMSFGGISRDSISEGAILVTKLSRNVDSGLYQDLPPIFDCDHTQRSITSALKKAIALSRNSGELERYRFELKQWYKINFEPEIIFSRYIEIITQ